MGHGPTDDETDAAVTESVVQDDTAIDRDPLVGPAVMGVWLWCRCVVGFGGVQRRRRVSVR